MTNKEKVAALRAIRSERMWPSGAFKIDALIAALESEPEPLAVVEGYIWHEHIEEGHDLLKCFGNGPLGGAGKGWVPVTVTITECKP